MGAYSIDNSELVIGSRSAGLGKMVQYCSAYYIGFKAAKRRTFYHPKMLQSSHALFKLVCSDSAIC